MNVFIRFEYVPIKLPAAAALSVAAEPPPHETPFSFRWRILLLRSFHPLGNRTDRRLFIFHQTSI